MKGFVWICLAACGSTRPPAAPDAATPDAPDAPDAGPIHRQRDATRAIAGPDRVVWSYGSLACPIPLREECPPLSPTVMASTAPTAMPEAWEETRGGVSIAGDENEVFLLDDTAELVRLRPGEPPTVLAPATNDRTGPAVDATHVYWSTFVNGTFEIQRATRTGDGSDAEVIATTPSRPDGFFLFAGYLCWGNLRVPVTGGTPAAFITDSNLSVFAVGPDALYTRQPLPPNGFTVRIGKLTADGTATTLFDLSDADQPSSYSIYDRGEVLWVSPYSELHAMSVTTEMQRTVGPLPQTVFAATADSILYNFTDTGYETMPR